MRVPIENGLGLINQVLDFIKLPALPEQSLLRITMFTQKYVKELYLNSIFPVETYSSSQNT